MSLKKLLSFDKIVELGIADDNNDNISLVLSYQNTNLNIPILIRTVLPPPMPGSVTLNRDRIYWRWGK